MIFSSFYQKPMYAKRCLYKARFFSLFWGVPALGVGGGIDQADQSVAGAGRYSRISSKYL